MTQKGPGSNLIMIGPAQWFLVASVVLILVPFIGAVFHVEEIYAACLKAYLGPTMQRHFGFRMRLQRMYFHERPYNVFVITDVDPNGIFARSGIQDGDIPVGIYHMRDAWFYNKLQQTEVNPVEIRVINFAEYEEILKSGNLVIGSRARRVLIPKVAFDRVDTPRTFPLQPARYVQLLSLMVALIVTLVISQRLKYDKP